MIRLYNSLTKQKEPFKPRRPGEVSLYTCGPTLYDRAHIGNLRTYVAWDVLRRHLEESGFLVKHVMNLTDIEDKIIAALQGEDLYSFTERYFRAFDRDLAKIRIRKPLFLRATDPRSIRKMEELIEKIWKNGLAYEHEGSIYLSVSQYAEKFPYGLFLKLDPEALRSSGRVEADEYGKDSPQDFALWKAEKPGEPHFEITVGGKVLRGRPGWHIECSAMSVLELGEEFDIHTGGVDHLFPHHENEIAQTRAATGKLLARYWLHTEFLSVEGKKMSKSLGNLITLEEIEERGYDPLDLRYLLLQAHYRSKQNFTWEALRGAAVAREKLSEAYGEVEEGGGGDLTPFRERLDDDLDTPGALAVLWQAVRSRPSRRLLEAADAVLGLGIGESRPVPDEVQGLAEEREKARERKDFETADRIREEIRRSGFRVEDTPDGPRLIRELD